MRCRQKGKFPRKLKGFSNRERASASGGYALIMVLLLVLLLSAVTLGLFVMVQTETRVGGGDTQNTVAFHAAEGAVEKMTADLATQLANRQAPTVADIAGLSSLQPANTPGITYKKYAFTPQIDPTTGGLVSKFGVISSGPNAGLFAQLIPVQLSATVQTGLGAEATVMRNVEIAMIPVFQFGVFSQSDLGFFSSPDLTFAGRVHTNGDLYLGVSNGAAIGFEDKISAYGNVIRAVLPNGLQSASNNNSGQVYILSAAGGCNNFNPFAPGGPNCKTIALNEGSVVGGPKSAQNTNPSWLNTSQVKFNSWIIDGNNGLPGGTGAVQLTLPFTGTDPNNPGAQPAQPFEIIRRPPTGEDPNGPTGQARLANEAAIRVLLSDTPQENHLDGSGVDGEDVQLVSQVPSSLQNIYTPPGGTTTLQNGVAVGSNTYYFGEANTNCGAGRCDADYVTPPTYHGQSFPGSTKEWPMIDGWLRVEYRDAAGLWHPITNEWLNLGFSRGVTPSVTAGTNQVNPNAILVFQQQATTGLAANGSGSQYNWLPINFYDAREGEIRDVGSSSTSCAPNGVMNAVELDIGNLRRWFQDPAGSGPNVDFQKENGYVLYFSDRRGMLPNPNNGNKMQGEYGFEDTINAGSLSGTVDGVLEPPTTVCPPANPLSRPPSPEDVNGNCVLDNYGATNVGDAFGINTNTNPPNPYSPRIGACSKTGRKNRVTGARHVLKLVDGTLGNLPTRPDGTGGFTVAAENPVYVLGNYNTNATDSTWSNPPVEQPHAAAGVIADAVTLLSNNWSDQNSFTAPSSATSRVAATTYYRTAIAAGKNLTFPAPNWINTNQFAYGTDGGVHNFLRFLEDWSNQTLNYKGSMVSLFYSTYDTGVFKCCNNAVYHPPKRNFAFDTLFTTPQGLPPGTPMFRDVDNLSYRQDFTPDAQPGPSF